MHTFFINTSSKEFKESKFLWEVAIECHSLVPMSCPLSDWMNKDNGYRACVAQMGTLIDGYKELNNDFNVVIYIDLPENKLYPHMGTEEVTAARRKTVTEAMKMLLTYYINKTVLKELSEVEGREPTNTLIMFGEEDIRIKNGQSVDINQENLKDLTSAFGGQRISKDLVKDVDGNIYYVGWEAGKTLKELFNMELAPGITKVAETMGYDNLAKENNNHGTELADCPYDGQICKKNKAEKLRFELNIAICLLKYMKAKEEAERTNSEAKEAKSANSAPYFYPYECEILGKALAKRLAEYNEAKKKAETATYSKLKLLTEPSEGGFNEALDIKVLPDNNPGTSADGSSVSKKDDAETLKGEVDKTKDRVDTYLNDLHEKVVGALSKYAGRSRNNDAEYLKRDLKPPKKGDDQGLAVEVRKNRADAEYVKKVSEYVEACKGGSVAVADISEQCDWIKSEIDKITERQKKIFLVVIGMLFAIVAAYIPFVVIQRNAIAESTVTLAIALISIAIPVAVLLAVSAVFALTQKKNRYERAWKSFKEAVKKAEDSNKSVADEYTKLLNNHIPSLRATYNYRADVYKYAAECASAAVKVEHHRKKLRAWCEAIEGLMARLEYAPSNSNGKDSGENGTSQSTSNDTEVKIDYTQPFCSGKNREFYSVIGADILDPSSDD